MIGGVITVVGLIVTRMPQAFVNATPMLPDNLTLPEGTQLEAVTFGKNWIAVVTSDDRLLIYEKSGTLVREIEILP